MDFILKPPVEFPRFQILICAESFEPRRLRRGSFILFKNSIAQFRENYIYKNHSPATFKLFIKQNR